MEQQNFHPGIARWYEEYTQDVEGLAEKLWARPELSMEEYFACEQTRKFLEGQGFQVETFHCKDQSRPANTVVATAGSGHPVIGFYGEYDALPGLGQEAVPERSPKEGPGHGCGHCLMTPACASAAAAAYRTMVEEGLPGTIRFIATPAEETAEGKPWLMKRGTFAGLDCCLSWHPTPYDLSPAEGILQAMSSYKFEFFGQAAHAAISPEAGRSALDAAELMNVGVQYLREHVTSDVRIHYTYLSAGERANIVPDYAATHYYIRAADMDKVEQVAARVLDCAAGAARMAGVEEKHTLLLANAETAILHSFNRFLYDCACAVPPIQYGPEEEAFAQKLHRAVTGKEGTCDPLPKGLEPPTGQELHYNGSTDAGYLTKTVPTARLYGLGIVRDTPGHHWGVTASVGSSIGQKAAVYVGKALAQCAVEIAAHPQRIDQWQAELREKAGEVRLLLPEE